MNCSQCGNALDEGVLYCRECRNLLLDGEVDGPVPDEDERVLLLAQGCELLLVREWDLATFRQWLVEFAIEQERREADVHEVYRGIPIGMEEDFREEIETGFQGVCSTKEAIASLSEYDPETTPPAVLYQALRHYYQGICAVKEAMSINRRNRARPLWI